MPSWQLELTYAQAAERIAQIAARYRARGYGRGHRVALQLENRPEFPLHFLALHSLGPRGVALTPDHRAAELEYVLAHSEASAHITAHNLDDLPQPKKAGSASE